MKIATLNVISRPNSKLLKTYPDLKTDTEDSIANKDKVSLTYKSNNLKNKSQWQIATSEPNMVILTMQEKILLKETEYLMTFTSN